MLESSNFPIQQRKCCKGNQHERYVRCAMDNINEFDKYIKIIKVIDEIAFQQIYYH